VNLSIRSRKDALEKIKEMRDEDAAIVIVSVMIKAASKFELGVFKFPNDTFIAHCPDIMTVGFNGYSGLSQWFKRNFAVHGVEIKRGYSKGIIQGMNSLL